VILTACADLPGFVFCSAQRLGWIQPIAMFDTCAPPYRCLTELALHMKLIGAEADSRVDALAEACRQGWLYVSVLR
jgi:hypothetical protein